VQANYKGVLEMATTGHRTQLPRWQLRSAAVLEVIAVLVGASFMARYLSTALGLARLRELINALPEGATPDFLNWAWISALECCSSRSPPSCRPCSRWLTTTSPWERSRSTGRSSPERRPGHPGSAGTRPATGRGADLLNDALTGRIEPPGRTVDARHAQRQDQADQRQRQDQLE
jgi:hypothetical protein